MSEEDSDSVKDAAGSLSSGSSEDITGKDSSDSVSKGISGGMPTSKGDVAKKAAGAAASKAPESVRKTTEKAAEVGQKAVQVKSAAGTAIGGTKAAVSGIVTFIGSPPGWVTVVLVIVIVGVLALVPLIGRNENADGCYGVGEDKSTSIDAEDSDDWKENAATIADWLMSTEFDALGGKPMTQEQAAGIIGNMHVESFVSPKTTQSDFTPSDTSNKEVLELGDAGGKAIGLLQFDADRRTFIAKHAEDEGEHWSDMGFQLEWIHMEIDGTAPYPDSNYNRDQLLKQNFDKSGEDIEFYTEAWEKGFTRAGKPNMPDRIKAAKEFNASYSPGSGAGFNESESGGSCLRGGGNVDTSDTIELAVSMSYPTSPESKVSSGDPYGKNIAKDEYIDAKEKAEKQTEPDPMKGLYASCDRFVATVVRLTMDPEIPWGSTTEQQAYLSKSSDWEQYEKKSEAEPGDVWVTKTNGHILLYLGDHEGKDTIAHASYLDRVAALNTADYVNDNMVDTSGRPYYGYRFTGDAPAGDGDSSSSDDSSDNDSEE